MIEVKDMTKYYGDFRAVDNISLSIKKGEITGLLGPNGAGKTTSMRMITGYMPSSSGRITVGGININDDPVKVKKMIGYLPESAPLYGDMLVYDYLYYIANIHDIVDKDQRIKETSEVCGLIDVVHKNINELSKGYRQRVGLAHAMIHNPEILILDEPTNGLDPNQIIEIRNLIKKIGKEKTVILSTHILSEVEATCDRVIIINKGAIVADNTTVALQSSHSRSETIHIKVQGPSFEELAATIDSIEGVSSFSRVDDLDNLVAGSVYSSASSDVRPLIFTAVKDKGWILYEMSREQNNLEQVFRDLTVGGDNE
jgi:ABC-2 type transport system ATP-binding protein